MSAGKKFRKRPERLLIVLKRLVSAEIIAGKYDIMKT